jgi:hypothetical protein
VTAAVAFSAHPPAWEIYRADPPGAWAQRGACATTHRHLDFTAEATAVAACAACAACPVLEQCAAWQDAQLPEARSWGAVAGAWWGLPGNRGARIARLDPIRVQQRALLVVHRSRFDHLPSAEHGQGRLLALPPVATVTRLHRRRQPRVQPPATPLWITWGQLREELEQAS